MGRAGVFGVCRCYGAAPEYAFDGCSAGAVGGGSSRGTLKVNVEGLAVGTGRALGCARGNVVSVKGDVASIAICIAAGLEIGKGVRVSGGSDCVQSWIRVDSVIEKLGWSVRASSAGTLVETTVLMKWTSKRSGCEKEWKV